MLKNIIKIINNFFYKKKELNKKELNNKYIVKLPYGSKFYHDMYKYQYHLVDGLIIEYDNGNREYYIKGKLHRVDGPAFEGADGYKAWYLNGERHRLDGPAIEYADGTKIYYLYNIEINKSAMKYIRSRVPPASKILN